MNGVCQVAGVPQKYSDAMLDLSIKLKSFKEEERGTAFPPSLPPPSACHARNTALLAYLLMLCAGWAPGE